MYCTTFRTQPLPIPSMYMYNLHILTTNIFIITCTVQCTIHPSEYNHYRYHHHLYILLITTTTSTLITYTIYIIQPSEYNHYQYHHHLYKVHPFHNNHYQYPHHLYTVQCTLYSVQRWSFSHCKMWYSKLNPICWWLNTQAQIASTMLLTCV